MSYIRKDDVAMILNSSKAIEQLLVPRIDDGVTILRILRIEKSRSGNFAAILLEVTDDGSPEFLDIYEFGAIDPDLPHGDIRYFDAAEEAVEYACKSIGADRACFLGSGMIQDEYKRVLRPDW